MPRLKRLRLVIDEFLATNRRNDEVSIDPKIDLENWLNRLVPENDSLYTHTFEGADDMPAHIKAALTASSLSIPIQNNRLVLGNWQGIYLWEHRYASGRRNCVIHIGA